MQKRKERLCGTGITKPSQGRRNPFRVVSPSVSKASLPAFIFAFPVCYVLLFVFLIFVAEFFLNNVIYLSSYAKSGVGKLIITAGHVSHSYIFRRSQTRIMPWTGKETVFLITGFGGKARRKETTGKTKA
jgi:hypothetical protein